LQAPLTDAEGEISKLKLKLKAKNKRLRARVIGALPQRPGVRAGFRDDRK